jgi:ankyrin repeat protein
MILRNIIYALILCGLVILDGCAKPSLEDKLIGAAASGSIPEIKRLLSLGVNVNCRAHSLNAGTPLIWAVRSRQENALEVLLAAGADPNIKTGTKESPLFLAYGSDQEDTSGIIKKLISAGANPDECRPLFEGLPENNPNRIAFEQAIKLRDLGEKKQ